MGNLVLAGSSSGSTTITPSATGTYTITLPAETGTIQTSGAGFTTNGVAYASSTSALTTGSALTFNGSTATPIVTITKGTAATFSGLNFVFSTATSSVLVNDSTGEMQYAAGTSSSGYFQTFKNNGTEAMRIDSSGNLIVGTTANSNGNKIYVAGTAKATGGIQEAVLSSYMNDDGSYSKTGIRAAIKAKTESGRGALPPYGIWASSQETDVGTCVGIYGKAIGTYGTQYAVYGEVSKNLAAYSDGWCFYAKATPTGSGGQIGYILGDDNGTTRFYVSQNGGIANYQAYNSNLSDRREKKDFAPSKSYLDVICAIPVQTFRYIDQKDDDLTLGVIAQDVQAVAPELVNQSDWKVPEGESRVRLSIYQTDLQYALMKSIQELNTLITAQQSTIQSLTERITALEGART